MTNSTKHYYNSIMFLNKKLCIKKNSKNKLSCGENEGNTTATTIQ